MGTQAQLFCPDTTGSQSNITMIQIPLRVAFLATASLAAPAAEADPFYGYGYGYPGLVAHAPYVAHAPLVVPVCNVVTKSVVVGKSCHAEPECTTKPVVVGRQVTVHEEPVCEDVEHVVPAVVPHVYGKRDADADPQFGYHAVAHPLAITTKVTTKHCTPGAPILEDITRDVTTCIPKQVCTDVEGLVHETVCGEPEETEEE